MKLPGIIVALDGMEVNEALYTAEALSGHVWGFKINDLLLEAGTAIIPRLRRFGCVFCDPKLFDIPSSVASSVYKLSRAGADMISVHAAANESVKMLMAAVKNRGKSKIVGISTLTSQEKISKNKLMLAVFNIVVARADGIVLGAKDMSMLKPEHNRLIKIVPGVRPVWWNPYEMAINRKDDQKRIATPRKAFKAGADFLVIGRPITQSENPAEAVERIQHEIVNTSTSLGINGERSRTIKTQE